MLQGSFISTHSADDEPRLVAAVATGDLGAFDQLYRAYERRVFQYILRFVRDPGLAEEVAADTLLTVWHRAHTFQKSSRVSTWILGIARHKSIDAVRRTLRGSPSTTLDEAAEIPSATPGPMDAAESRALERLTRQALEHLSVEHREVLYLAFYEDVPYEEIAALLEVPQNTVKTRVYYAKQKLREQFERLTAAGATA